jgi:hypothetical protein
VILEKQSWPQPRPHDQGQPSFQDTFLDKSFKRSKDLLADLYAESAEREEHGLSFAIILKESCQSRENMIKATRHFRTLYLK